MHFNGSSWFCYSDPETGKCSRMGALEEAMYEFAPQEYLLKGNYNNAFQGQTFAAVVVNGNLVAEFGSARGGRGLTNLFIGRLDEKTPRKEIPGLIREHGWTWYEWVPDELKS